MMGLSVAELQIERTRMSENIAMPKKENIPFKFMNCAVLAKT